MPMLMMLSREVRRVPLDWQHPTDERGNLRPLLDGSFTDAVAEWDAERAAWERGEFPDYASEETRALTYEEWAEERPVEAHYMPTFPADATLGICMYEEVTEGTPISPVFPDSEDGRTCMAAYLVANPSGITEGMTIADWLAIIGGGLGTKDVHTGQIEVR